MGRPHTEFVQSQRLEWRRHALDQLRSGTTVRVLSSDPRTGACSLVVRYPRGFRCGSGALGVDDELLVLDGALTIGSETHAAMSFAHLPAGFDSGAWSSDDGAVVLEFFSGEPVRGALLAAFDPERLVRCKSLFEVPYTGNFHPEFPPGAGRKLLYQDPQSRDTTWVLGTLPLRWAEKSEVHPTVEEMYLLAGEVHGDRGIMRPGAYFWRPPMVPHGPYGSQTGNLYFFRTKGGLLATTYVDPQRPFGWFPAYDALLPSELEYARGEVPSQTGCW